MRIQVLNGVWPVLVLVGIGAAAGCGSNESSTDSAQAFSKKAPVASDDDECDDKDDQWPHDWDKPGNGPKKKCKDAGSPPPPPPPSECDASVPPPPPPGPDAGTPPPAPCGFTPYNDGLVGGQIADVAYDSRTPGVAWAAAGPRLFKSTDSGATWSMVWEGTFGFRKLSLPAGDANVLMAATSSGVAKSVDGGATWSVISLDGLSISSLLVHPAQPLRVYAGVRGAGIIRSNDGGLTWNTADFGVPYGEYPSMAADPANPDIVFVVAMEQDALGALTRSVILRTTNAGASWTAVQDNAKTITYEIATCAANPDVMYASAANYYGGTSGVLRSNDRGLTWATTAGLSGKLVTDIAIAPSDCEALYAVHYGTALKRSTDGGATFSGPLTNGIPFFNNFPRHVSVDPASSARAIGASHGGVLYTADAGGNFSVVGGVMNLAIRSMAVSPLDPNRLWLATWGSGAWQRASDASSWVKSSLNVDYMFNVSPDPAVANRTFLGTWSYPFATSDGASFAQINVSKNPFAFAFDAASTGTIYMATQIGGLYKSTNGGAAWATSNGSLVAWDTGAGTFIDTRTVVVDRSASNRVLVGTNGRGIYRSEDSGATLSPVAPSLAGKLVSLIVQASDGAFYAVVDGSGIAKSTDQGATFDYVTSGLPSLNVSGLTEDATTGTLYSTSNLGVFASSNGGSTWSSFGGSCLPVGGAGVAAILGSGASRKLVVATGRGVFAHGL